MKVRINAPIDVPKADNMSVVTVEELKLDTNYKKKVLKAYFKDSEIYYHDLEHLTREELQSAILYEKCLCGNYAGDNGSIDVPY